MCLLAFFFFFRSSGLTQIPSALTPCLEWTVSQVDYLFIAPLTVSLSLNFVGSHTFLHNILNYLPLSLTLLFAW